MIGQVLVEEKKKRLIIFHYLSNKDLSTESYK